MTGRKFRLCSIHQYLVRSWHIDHDHEPKQCKIVFRTNCKIFDFLVCDYFPCGKIFITKLAKIFFEIKILTAIYFGWRKNCIISVSAYSDKKPYCVILCMKDKFYFVILPKTTNNLNYIECKLLAKKFYSVVKPDF